MLLVNFHGGSGGVNNVYGYSTKNGQLETKSALGGLPKHVKLDELRAMAVYNGNLYVASGAKNDSAILVFAGPPKPGPEFDYLDVVIGGCQSIMHPFALAFDLASPHFYVSNQDSNVVVRLKVKAGKHGAVTGTLGKGCQSRYLTGLYPPPAAFLDGTFVASQVGELAGVTVKNIPNVSAANGGLGVTMVKGKPLQPANSVRDTAVANDILFVCDEVDSRVNMYNLSSTIETLTLGTFLGSGTHMKNPTHLAVHGGGLWVSAEDKLYWSALPGSPSGATLSFSSIAITVPANHKVGGISFDNSNHVYVIFQEGTHETGTGSISKYAVSAGSPPALSSAETFATIKEDTPEFCLWVSDSHWHS